MSHFSTVLWDVGGVLLTNGWDHNQRKTVFDQLGFDDRDAFEERHAEANDPWEKGTIDFEEYLRQTVFFRERPFTPAQLRAAIEAQSVVLEDTAMPILRELHERGDVQMGQLNNESRELNDFRLERFGLKQYLSTFFCSGYVGLRKPDPAIFRMALEILQRPAAEVIFIDDREKNAAAATAMGLHGLVYKGAAVLRGELETLGVL